MKDLVRDLMPHAPQMGLFVAPDIPETRLHNAIQDYAPEMAPDEVLALYDATLSGSGKDGAVFAPDRFVFQNTDLQAPQTVHYSDLIGVESKRKWMGLGGRKVDLTINRGRATFELAMDFSGQPDAAEYVAAFLDEALMHGVETGSGSRSTSSSTPPSTAGTDVDALRDALEGLVERGELAPDDFQRVMALFDAA